MEKLGGQNIVVVYDDPHERRFGGAIARVLVTAPRPSQLKIMADTLVRHMRQRKLQECDVFAAKEGPEGDEASNWMVVDCRNFVVHIMEEQMRNDLNLEELWSGNDPLHRVNFYDEDEVDEYVAAHPVPETYGKPVFDWEARFRELQKNRWTAPHKPVVKRPRMKRKKR
jgi:ribosomal silencing factor RsfS